jgi:hypothetical protein
VEFSSLCAVFLPMVLQIPQDYASFFALQNYASHDKAPFISYIVDLCFKKIANLAHLLTKNAWKQTDLLKY